MAYRNDSDLEFLGNVSSEDLDPLVQILIDKGKLIPGINTETLTVPGVNTETLTGKSEYKKHNPDHHAYWELIAEEIQLFGANTIASLARGIIGEGVLRQGVLYREILTDVCDREKVNYNKRSSVHTIEENLLMKVLVSNLDEMSPEELEEICREFKIKPARYTGEAVFIAIQAALRLGKFRTYQLLLIGANKAARKALGHGLSFAANKAATKGLSVALKSIAPIITTGWLISDVASPATRVTRPVVIMIAVLRRHHQESSNGGGSEGEAV